MKIRGFLFAGIMSVSWMSMTSTASIYTLDLSYGSFPDDVTVVDGDGLALRTRYYKHGATDKGWTVDRYDRRGYVAVSPTFSDKSGKQDNRLVLPPVNITGDNVAIRWGACSVHPDLPDSYDVIAKASDGKENVIFSTRGESPEWVTRAVDLSEYVGKEVSVTFVATSEHGYMLAIGDVEIGEMTDSKFQVVDLTPRYTGMDEEEVTVTGTITNVGRPLDIDRLVCKVNDEIVDQQTVNAMFTTGSSIKYDFSVTPEFNRTTNYAIYGIDMEGNEVAIHDDSFFTSYFRRTLFVDKGTGMWCNNCPKGSLDLETLKARYGEQLIAVETHVDDALDLRAYWNELGFYAAPYFKLNRNDETSYHDCSRFSTELKSQTSWLIQFSEFSLDGDRLTVGVKTKSALDVDNSTDRYRISYVVTRDYDEQPEETLFYQSNNMTGPTGKRFYYLPAYVPDSLVKFHDVTLPSEFAFTGIESSLPSTLAPYEEYVTTLDIPVSDYPEDLKNINIVVYLLDTYLNRVRNAATMTLDRWNGVTSIDNVTGGGKMDVTLTPGGHCRVDFGDADEGERYTLELFSASGARLGYVEDCVGGSLSADHDFSLPKGIVIARLQSGDCHVAKKFVIK